VAALGEVDPAVPVVPDGLIEIFVSRNFASLLLAAAVVPLVPVELSAAF
jgi:hypothetical protein